MDNFIHWEILCYNTVSKISIKILGQDSYTQTFFYLKPNHKHLCHFMILISHLLFLSALNCTFRPLQYLSLYLNTIEHSYGEDCVSYVSLCYSYNFGAIYKSEQP